MVSHLFHLACWKWVSEKEEEMPNEMQWERGSKENSESAGCHYQWNIKIMDCCKYDDINYNICDRKRGSQCGRILSTHRVWETGLLQSRPGTELRGNSVRKAPRWGVSHISVSQLPPLLQRTFSVSFLGSRGRRQCSQCSRLSIIRFV